MFIFFLGVCSALLGSRGLVNLNNMTLKVQVFETVFYQILNNSDPQLEIDFQSYGLVTITNLT